ncbi:hypothetical protein MYIN104542_09160 [Mycobacterium intermedium]
MPDQPGRAARTAGLACGTGSAPAAVAVQDAAGTSRCAGPVGTIGAVADQRSSEQGLGGCVDQVEQLLQGRGVGRFGGGIRARTGLQRLHELGVIRRRLLTDRLVGLCMAAEQCRHGRRDLIGAGGQHVRGGKARCGIGRDERLFDVRQIRRRGRDIFRHREYKRHVVPPKGPEWKWAHTVTQDGIVLSFLIRICKYQVATRKVVVAQSHQPQCLCLDIGRTSSSSKAI